VSEIRFLKKKSKERAIQLEILANEGNFKHNTHVLRTGKGFLVVARRLGKGNKVSDYLPCEFCFKFFVRSRLWLHVKKCLIRKFYKIRDSTSLNKEQESRNHIRRGKSLLTSATLDSEDSNLFHNLLTRMCDGNVRNVVMQDEIIKKFAILRMESLGDSHDQKKNDIYRVSQGARMMARLVLEARKVIPCSLDSLIRPENFNLVVNATKALCLSSGSHSIAGRIGHLLGHSILVKIGIGLRMNDESKGAEAKAFQTLFELEWTKRVASLENRRLHKSNLMRKTEIPSTEDLVKFNQFLVERVQILLSDLEDCPSDIAKSWRDLCRFTMCRLILFNKRRVSEVTDLLVETYLSRPAWNDGNDEFDAVLDETEKHLAKRYTSNPFQYFVLSFILNVHIFYFTTA